MQYIRHYESPLGRILLAADDQGLTGLWFEEGKNPSMSSDSEYEEKNTPVLDAAAGWLNEYFTGRNPGTFRPIHMLGTDFQKTVWKILLTIPYGSTVTYSEIADRIAQSEGRQHMSAQAVGGAVGHNRIAIIIPCHRVIGADGSLTGYAGGIRKKEALLKLEHAYTDDMYIPAEGKHCKVKGRAEDCRR